MDLPRHALEILLVAQLDAGPSHGVRGIAVHEADDMRKLASLRIEALLLAGDLDFAEVVRRDQVVHLLAVAHGQQLVAFLRPRIGVHHPDERPSYDGKDCD